MNNTADLLTELSDVILPEVKSATDQQIIDRLKHSLRYSEFADEVERNILIESICKQLKIEVSEDEIQNVGDAFRKQNKLYGEAETMAWLDRQRITPEDWSKGVYIQLLTQKLKEHIGGYNADALYMNDRENWRRVALSQILTGDLATAIKISESIREKGDSFCMLALEYSKGKQSKENGGFAGIRFVAELLPEIAAAIDQAPVGEVLEPVKSKLGYHILRVEKWFSPEFNEVKDFIAEYLFQFWLTEKIADKSNLSASSLPD
jgi:parvulin-like peptidyl-prolyl isomerase